LDNQTQPKSLWELLLIDNASKEPLSIQDDLSWHSNARYVREDDKGLTPARLRGITESQGDILLFVDDDNVLAPSYLQQTIHAFDTNLRLGCLGAAIIAPEFESEPSSEILPFVQMLALRHSDRPLFSNDLRFNHALPYGAGIAVTRSVALAYSKSCALRTSRKALDRVGNELLSGGDIDLALHACASGLIAGVVPELSVLHLIPNSRLDPEYLVRLAYGHAVSHEHLARLWGYKSRSPNGLLFWLRHLRSRLKLKGLARRIYLAETKARRTLR